MISYCNLNPVKHGLAADPFDWPYSSVHRDMRTALALGAARRATLGRSRAPHGEPVSRPSGPPSGKTPPMVPVSALSPAVPLR